MELGSGWGRVTDLISVFRGEANEICTIVRHNAAYSGNSLPTFRDYLSVPSGIS